MPRAIAVAVDIVTDVNALHPWNAPAPILVTELGNSHGIHVLNTNRTVYADYVYSFIYDNIIFFSKKLI